MPVIGVVNTRMGLLLVQIMLLHLTRRLSYNCKVIKFVYYVCSYIFCAFDELNYEKGIS